MENSCVFQILRTNAAAAACAALFVCGSLTANATTLLPSQTLKSGTKIACVLDEHLNSSKLSYGDEFKLRVVDTAHPVLEGSEIIGYITDVRQPSGANLARVGFYLTSIRLSNGKKKSISAYIVSKRVVAINPGAQYTSRQQVAPMTGVPYGTVTPGPIAWQMRIGNGPSSVQGSSPNLGGYVYATSAHAPIVVNAGTPVTVELSESLTIP
jgi:hypothetical protein